MVQLSSLLAVCAFACTVAALPHSKNHASANNACASAGQTGTNPKAVYFITNAAENSVVALKVAADGTLSDGSITATGGAGMSGIDGSTNLTAAPDSLFSQGAVKVAGKVSLPLLTLGDT